MYQYYTELLLYQNNNRMTMIDSVGTILMANMFTIILSSSNIMLCLPTPDDGFIILECNVVSIVWGTQVKYCYCTLSRGNCQSNSGVTCQEVSSSIASCCQSAMCGCVSTVLSVWFSNYYCYTAVFLLLYSICMLMGQKENPLYWGLVVMVW